MAILNCKRILQKEIDKLYPKVERNLMKTDKIFFENQSELTAYKIFFYEEYLGKWLIKLLMGYGRCFIGDLFCGTGKNGEKEGSPLILIKEAKKIIAAPPLRKKYPNPQIGILFNDNDENKISELKKNLSQLQIPKEIKIFELQNKQFNEITTDLSKEFKQNPLSPKFFFLDPFAYSTINIVDLKQLIDYRNTEIFLFLPVFHAYRFSDSDKVQCLRLKNFLDNFTLKRKCSDIYDFVNNIKERLESDLKCFVRPIIIEGDHSKNCLFLLTKNIGGLNEINKLVWKTSAEIYGLNINKYKNRLQIKNQPSLFKPKEVEDKNIIVLKDIIKKKLENEKEIFNTDLVKFTIINMYLTKHAELVVYSLLKDGLVKIEYLKDKFKKGCLYLSTDNLNNKMCKIIWMT